MKHIAILGSTGSIGRSALGVIRHHPDKFCVWGLSAHADIAGLYRQIEEFRPRFACVSDAAAALKLKSKLKGNKGTKLFAGQEGLKEMVQDRAVDEVIMAISGSGALLPLLAAIESSKEIALANKEALVMAGPLIMHKADKYKAKIIPVDSEQSAIWQCLDGRGQNKLKNIYLTASGGPFRQALKKDLKYISIRDVLRHPRWKMGKKITVDSATLMNKGLEVLEAMYLFKASPDKIKIIIHPEAIIHSMVEFIDGVILAQLSATDMRIPIQYALSYPQRINNSLPSIDFHRLRSLTFQQAPFKKFPCLGLAYRAARDGGTMPAVLNAANEASVSEFLKGNLNFLSIPRVIEKVLGKHRNNVSPDLGDILSSDAWAREEAHKVMERLGQA